MVCVETSAIPLSAKDGFEDAASYDSFVWTHLSRFMHLHKTPQYITLEQVIYI